jgi:predicted RecB family nuclease
MDMKETALLQLILEKGLEFESEVVQDVRPQEVQSREEIEPIAKKSVLIQVPKIFRNHELGIQGIPDLINTDRGKLLPIEIKNHKAVTSMDELELAFYWLLLDPLRKKRVKPRGYIILNNKEIVPVDLTEDHFEQVEFILDGLRQLMETGTEPSLSNECKQCTLKENCRQQVVQSGGLSIIYNISSRRERQFRDIGISSISELIQVDEEQVNAQLISRFGNTPGIDEILRMKCHAFSIRSGKPFFFGDREELKAILSSPLLVLDLEYDPEHLIWLVGLALKTEEQTTYHQFFAEKANLDEEKRILNSLIKLRRKHISNLFITYGGISADLPQLRKAWQRHGFPCDEFSTLVANHVDLYQFLRKSFRFPIESLSLDDTEKYIGIERYSKISNGLEALAEYKRYVRTRDNTLKQQLMDYNREDVKSTLSIIDALPKLVDESIKG